MPAAQFDWDAKKNDANQKKHHVCFQAAQAGFGAT
jgi:uncharacterized DUF497 family protein